jgi:drug/metabolite transporter (DMT)-like permease
VSPHSVARLLLLAALWGSAFLFVRVAAPQVGPLLTVEARVAIAGLALLAYVLASGLALRFAVRWPMFLMLGALNSAIPFVLVAFGLLHLTASFSAILIATAPLSALLVARIWLKEAVTARKLVGLTVGVVGVGILVGFSPVPLSPAVLTAVAATLAAGLCYALAAAYSKTRISGSGIPPMVMAMGSQLGAAVLLLPGVPFAWPDTAPSAVTVGALFALGLGSSALGFVLYFRLIEDVGPVKTLTVNFLSPLFGVAGGVLFLGEPLTVAMLVGGAIVLASTALVLDLSWLRGPRSTH